MVLTAEFITGLLEGQERSQPLDITSIHEVERFTGCADQIARYRLKGMEREAPFQRTLIAKVFGPNWYHSSGVPELFFYQNLAPQMPEIPVPRLLGTWDDPDSETIVLLIEDLGQDFQPMQAPVKQEHLELLTDLLVQMHSRWWDHAGLMASRWLLPESGVTCMPQALNPRGLDIHTQRALQALSGFVERHRQELTLPELHLLEQLSGCWPHLFAQRVLAEKHLTLIHGDLHLLGNVFVSRTGSKLCLIDWTQVKRGLGTHDLMYMLLSVDDLERQSRDMLLLRRYHTGLEQAGVKGYSWEQCVWDYRLSILTNLWQSVLQGSVRWLRKTLEVLDSWDAQKLLELP